MTQPADKPKSSLKEYLILILIILVGLPIAWYWGARDGRDLAAKAYGEAAESAADDEDYDDYDDYDDSDDDHEEDVASSSEATPEAIGRGETLYKANCAACHGEKGDGKGPAAVAFTPAPRDFTDPNAKWTKGREPAQVFASISNGIEGTGMAGFAGALTEAQRWDLVHYIASLSGAGER